MSVHGCVLVLNYSFNQLFCGFRLAVHGLMGTLQPSGVVEAMQTRKMKRPPCYHAKWSSLESDKVSIKQYNIYQNETEA